MFNSRVGALLSENLWMTDVGLPLRCQVKCVCAYPCMERRHYFILLFSLPHNMPRTGHITCFMICVLARYYILQFMIFVEITYNSLCIMYIAAWVSEFFVPQWGIFRRESVGLWLSRNSASRLLAWNFQQFTPGGSPAISTLPSAKCWASGSDR